MFVHVVKATRGGKSGYYCTLVRSLRNPPNTSLIHETESTSRGTVMEKDYENLKVRMRRPRHSLEEHLEDKVFILFLITVMKANAHIYILSDNLLNANKSMEDNKDVVCNAK